MKRKTIIVLAITLLIVGAFAYGVIYAEAHMSENVTMALYIIIMPVGLILAIVTLVRWILLWRNSTPEERKAYTEYRRNWRRRDS